MTCLYDLTSTTLEGEPAPLDAYRGKVALIVNLASECGYTPQYVGLQTLHAALEGRGFTVLGFPSDDFGCQEPGDAATIRDFADTAYGVTFPLFAKCGALAGPEQSPVYDLLGEATGKLPEWNFCKYLVGRDGSTLGFYPSAVTPEDEGLRQDIERALAGAPAPA